MRKKTIFIIDNNKASIESAEKILKPYYNVSSVDSADKGIAAVSSLMPDLILLNISMPDKDGFKTFKIIKSNTEFKNVPIIFICDNCDIKNELSALNLGGADILYKPFIADIMLIRIKNQIELADLRKNLEKKVSEKASEIEKLNDTLILGFAELVECRDGETGGHILRTARYLEFFAKEIYRRNLYPNIFTKKYLKDMIRSAPIHDIGKIGISDKVLLKTGSFDDSEREYMKHHTILGGNALSKIIDKSTKKSFLYVARDMALYHHEKWDGTGYPDGLKEKNIPLCARIMAICDVYDALTSQRKYKKAFSHEKACDIIISGKNTQFDPELIDIFSLVKDNFFDIKESFISSTVD
ncbi:HD domain-containing phosphohydrolase [Clostridium sp. BJN0001]|uniref:HD domain-containing phosphohydrolase n=1 Tax=Clostridium sp. BJN0001 TaxID=2930219 RepID=UPI001FD2F9D1|nr:HD domain-containing phosphohydrolase [Clostridium sp. BJN0001]